MTTWFLAITLAGFVPDSIKKIELVRAGLRPAFPIALHVHAVLMGAFLLLLFAQSWLMATGRRMAHKEMGVVGFGLALALFIAGIVLITSRYHEGWAALQTADTADERTKLGEALARYENVMWLQLRAGVLFTVFMVIAFRARKHDPGLHKRMVLLATVVPLEAALGRLEFLPKTPGSTTGADLKVFAAISPMLFWDIVRYQRVHKAYWIWLGICLPLVAIGHLLWQTPWWHATARSMMGV